VTGIFENDGATDWLEDFTAHPDIVKINSAFRLTGDSAGYPDALDCEEALAAAAVLASLLAGQPIAGIPHQKFESLMLSEFAVKKDLVQPALQSAKQILNKSELRDLWEEDDMFSEWELSVRELITELEKLGN
jgi:hypothetical protein